jgi:putative ABC transport system substrate-binding protein
MILLGGAAAVCPVAARAQQSMPVIGFLHPASPDGNADRMRAFRQGLKEAGFVEGENVAIDYRWAESHFDRLPALAAELVQRQVAVIVAAGGPMPALAAKAATATIPIIFNVPEDPVGLGLVTNLARPDGNLTGINAFSEELLAKRLELLREMVPATTRLAVLISPGNSTSATLRNVEAATRAMKLEMQVFNADNSREIEAAFASFVRERPDALFVAGGPIYVSRRVQLALQAARHAVPASYGSREYVEVGGLMSYGASQTDAYRLAGVYAGRVLKGAKPADMPILQSTKFELVINHAAARVLGLTISPSLLARADEVIE